MAQRGDNERGAPDRPYQRPVDGAVPDRPWLCACARTDPDLQCDRVQVHERVNAARDSRPASRLQDLRADSNASIVPSNCSVSTGLTMCSLKPAAMLALRSLFCP